MKRFFSQDKLQNSTVMNKAKNIFFVQRHFFIFLSVYLIFIALLAPWGNFPINDDWDNQLQILAFQEGDIRIHSQIDAAFILQPWVGYLWATIFGSTFTSLRVLTILFSIALAWIFKKYFQENNIVLGLIAFFLHPLVLASSLSFMTEIYFMFLAILSYLHFEKYLEQEKKSDVVLGSLFTGMSILMRQLGFVIPIAFIITLLIKKKLTLRALLIPVLTTALFVFIWQIYPRAGTQEPFIYSFVEPKYFKDRLLNMLFIFPFIGISLAPFFLKSRSLLKPHIVVPSLVLAYLIYKLDVLPLGNVFYLECLYCRTRYNPTITLFDNSIFKIIIALIVSLTLVSIVENFVKHRKKIDVFSAFCVLGYYFILLFPEDIYDRYALPAVLFLVILAAKTIPKLKVSISIVIVISIISFVLNWEFFRVQEKVYTQMKKISSEMGLVRDIYSVDIYAMYEDALFHKDYLGETTNQTLGRDFQCVVDSYYLDSENGLNKLFTKVENLQERYLPNPGIYNRKKRKDVKRVKKHLDELVYNEEYFSFLHFSTGKKTYVGSFCEEGASEWK